MHVFSNDSSEYNNDEVALDELAQWMRYNDALMANLHVPIHHNNDDDMPLDDFEQWMQSNEALMADLQEAQHTLSHESDYVNCELILLLQDILAHPDFVVRFEFIHAMGYDVRIVID